MFLTPLISRPPPYCWIKNDQPLTAYYDIFYILPLQRELKVSFSFQLSLSIRLLSTIGTTFVIDITAKFHFYIFLTQHFFTMIQKQSFLETGKLKSVKFLQWTTKLIELGRCKVWGGEGIYTKNTESGRSTYVKLGGCRVSGGGMQAPFLKGSLFIGYMQIRRFQCGK